MSNLNLTKEQQLILLGLIISFLVGLGVLGWRHFVPSVEEGIVVEAGETAISQGLGEVVVHVAGAVRREGVYKLKTGDRLLDALDLAGGPLPTADLSGLNLAENLKDGQKIIVPSKCPAVVGQAGAAGEKINLNTATEEQLDSLPGVGKSTAQQIIAYRKNHGAFTKVEQLTDIPRFGKAKLERIKEKLSL